ncbi:MAG: sensor histidine kinase [Propionibacteriales bacterium]|nr:sensor histidine kinase [Propionibacteriales bacterium]
MRRTLVKRPRRERFVHEALMYRGEEEYLAGVVPFVRSARAADQPVLVAVPGQRVGLVRDALGDEAAGVVLLDMADHGRNPGRIIPAVLRRFADDHARRRVSIVGEPIWPGRSWAEYGAAVQHEALINLAFAGRDAAILCPYDIAGLDARASADAERTHPVVVTSTERHDSATYGDPQRLAASQMELPATPAEASTMSFTVASAVRRVVAYEAGRAGLPSDRLADLELAVNEVATNSLIHAGGSGVLSVWSERGHLVCEVRDSGHITDPLAGRITPPVESTTGRGLLLANCVCDLVQVRTHPSGTTIRLWMRLLAS